MINAGAIMAISLIESQKDIGDRFDFIVKKFQQAAGNEYLNFNASVFLSERESADRNNCLAYFMKENGCYKPKPENKEFFKDTESKFKESLELYFQICSQETTAESSSVIAATLANGGVCPTTNEEVFKPGMIKNVLSLMMTCGMYDYSGEFAFSTGLPAKSGVGGSIIIVIPNLCGICCFSPPLDAIGNSVKGVEFASKLVDIFSFHNFDNVDKCLQSGKIDPRRYPTDLERQELVEVLFAAQVGDLAQIMNYVNKGFNFNNRDYDDRTAMHVLASSENSSQCISFLLKYAMPKIDPYLKDRWGNTAADDARSIGNDKSFRLFENYRKRYDTLGWVDQGKQSISKE